ncbi:MAG: hypothetical protein Kow0010_23160 [Dehalococcoidia bacterium]
MALVFVVSEEQGAGKTGVAAAIARHYAYQGRPTRLMRLSSDLKESNAEADAQYFATLEFAPGSPAGVVTAGEVADNPDGLVVVEGDLAAMPAIAGAKVVLVATNAPSPDQVEALGAAAIVMTSIPRFVMRIVPATIGDAAAVAIPEDRCLAGFSVSEAQQWLNAERLVEGDRDDPTSDYLVIAPIGSDAGQPYLRRFPSKAVVVRFDKTDQHLAALASEPNCLILTGGRRPSEYLFDAAGARGVPVLLSATDTENTVLALEDIYGHTRFQGERKLNRMSELLEASKLFETLGI